MTLSGWLKLGELERAFPLPGMDGQRPSSFLPHVRTLAEDRKGQVNKHTQQGDLLVLGPARTSIHQNRDGQRSSNSQSQVENRIINATIVIEYTALLNPVERSDHLHGPSKLPMMNNFLIILRC